MKMEERERLVKEEATERDLREGRIRGREEGRKEGRIEGKREEKIEIAKEMLKENMPIQYRYKYIWFIREKWI